MENFQFYMPTRILFGREQILHLPEIMAGFGKKVLLAYGGGNIKNNGLYDKVRELLPYYEIYEISGIARNPKIGSVREGVTLCREHDIDMILAVGGGSVIDCSKAIAAAYFYQGDAWEMIAGHAEIKKALPIVTVLTLAAAGSEADPDAIISNPETNEKLAMTSPKIFPAVSILDPTYTFTVPASQTAAGSIDILSHLMEQYFVHETTYLSDLLVESVMKTVIKYAPIAFKEPENYEARGQLMWASTIADNAMLCSGNRPAAFSCHGIEHELSAYYDITHGVGLAVITPHWMEYVLSEETAPRFAHFGKEVWGVRGKNDMETAKLAIQATKEFFEGFHVSATLTALGIGIEHFDEMASHAVDVERLAHAWIPLEAKDVKNILKISM